MVDFLGMMKKAEELQKNMQQMQEQLGQATVEGFSGGGLVTVTLTGKLCDEAMGGRFQKVTFEYGCEDPPPLPPPPVVM